MLKRDRRPLFSIIPLSVVFLIHLPLAHAQNASPANPPEQPGPQPPDDLVQARLCQPQQICPQFGALVRLLNDPTRAEEAAGLLGQIGDIRAIGPLAQVAVYDKEPRVRDRALNSLVQLAQTPTGAATLTRTATSDPDPEIRAVAARALPASPARATPPPPERTPAKQQHDVRASDPTRVLWGQTAIGRQQGEASWSVYDLGYHTFDYGITDHLQFSVGTVIPIGIYALYPQLKLSAEPWTKIHVGLSFGGGTAGTYMDGVVGAAFWGGGPVFTFGDERFMINVAAPVGGAVPYGSGVHETVGWAVTPNIGVSYRVSRSVRLNLEHYSVVYKEMDVYIGGVLYGVRIFNDTLFGDVSFFIPIFPGVEDVLKYIPLGFPLLTFGVIW